MPAIARLPSGTLVEVLWGQPEQKYGVRCSAIGARVVARYGGHLQAQEVLGQNPLSGVALVFRAKRADRVKILVWDGSGLVLYWKRLENGAFKWPPVTDGVMRMNAAQLAALLSGMDWTRMHAPRIARPKEVV